MVILGAIALFVTGANAAVLERRALQHTETTAVMLGLLGAFWVAIRVTAVALARRDTRELRFEEEMPAAVQGLGLSRDGVISAAVAD